MLSRLPKPKVLIIDNHDSFTYNLVQLVRQSKLCSYDVVLNTELDVDSVSCYSHIIISPGPGLPEETENLFEVLSLFHKTHSILGVCLGHQAIACFFGASLIRLDKPLHGIGSKILVSEVDPLFNTLPAEIIVGRYHSWIVDENSLPDCLSITARTTDGIIMGLNHNLYNVRGLQFHPESVITAYGAEMINNWLKI